MAKYHYSRIHPLLAKVGFILDIFAFPIKWISKKEIVHPPQNILVFESHLIGDCVMTLAMISKMREYWPDAKITFLANAWAASLVPSQIKIDFVTLNVPWATYNYSFSNIFKFIKTMFLLRKRKLDLTLETRGDPRNAFTLWLMGARSRIGLNLAGGTNFLTHAVSLSPQDPLSKNRILLLSALGIEDATYFSPLPISLKDIEMVRKFLLETKVTERKYIVIHPGASNVTRQMNKVTFENIVEQAEKSGLQIVLAAGPQDKELVTNLASYVNRNIPIFKGNIKEFLALCSLAHEVFTMDSGPAHLAAWTGTQTHVFCVHDSPEIVTPFGKAVTMHSIEAEFSN